MSYQKDRDEFVGVIVAECELSVGNRAPENTKCAVGLARLILRNAATIQRIAAAYCNRKTTPGEVEQYECCQDRIRKACEPWGIKPTFNGDPRGACVKLLLPSGRNNSFGGAECGFCVPTR